MKGNNPLLTVIIPVFNEKGTVAEIVSKVFAVNMPKQVIIVDDGSNDGTSEVLNALKDRFDFELTTHSKRRGKGAAIIDALPFASGKYTIIQDADLEYDPADYLLFFDFVESKESAVRAVYGSRFLNGRGRGTTRAHFFANSLFAALTNILFHAKLTDIETGYKFIETNLLKELNLRCLGFDVEIEITAKLLKRRIRIEELPISYTAREVKQGKKIRFKDGLSALFSIIKYRFITGK